MSDYPTTRVGAGDYGYSIDVDMGVDLSTATAIRARLRSPSGAVITVDLAIPGASTTVAQVGIVAAYPLSEVGTWDLTVAAKSATFDISSELVKVSVEPRSVRGDFWT